MKPPDSHHDSTASEFSPSTTTLLLLSVTSAVVYLTLTFVILRVFHNAPLSSLFRHGYSFHIQLFTGILFGLLAAGIIAAVMLRTSISDILTDYAIVNLIAGMRLTPFDRLQISFFAGAGEELLFRGALQPLIGIGLASILFVGIHGYFKFTSFKHILYGGIMFALSVGLGLLYEWSGLVAAMCAHAVYDLVMLRIAHRFKIVNTTERNPA